MNIKDKIRKNYSSLRKKKYYEITDNFYLPLISLIKKFSIKNIKLALYYPSNYEVNTIPLFKNLKKKKIKFSLPTIISTGNKMKFIQWNYLDPLKVNRFGMLEPNISSRIIKPNIFLIPLLAYDNQKNRLGYGKGFYDDFLNKHLKKDKKIITIGVAFSFQKYNKLPVSKYDVKLNYILTEKGII